MAGGGATRRVTPMAEPPGFDHLEHLPVAITGECIYCENTEAQFTVMPREGKALRVRCEGCGAVTEVER